MASVSRRKIVNLRIWVEYVFGDADRKRGATIKVPICGVADLLKLPPSLPSESPDLTDGVPHSLCVEATFEGGHSTYCEIGAIGGAFGSLALALDEAVETP